jgi:hypothetical protein
MKVTDVLTFVSWVLAFGGFGMIGILSAKPFRDTMSR